MSGKNTLYAEWDKEEGNFRLFYDSDIQNTIATVNTILEVKQFAESGSLWNFSFYD